MPIERQGALLNRSPRSRKSLAVGSTGPALPTAAPARRKRAHSIAPGENLKTSAAPRRSLLRPKGILKPSNQADQTQDMTQDISEVYQHHPSTASPDDTNMTGNLDSATPGEYYTDVRNNSSRKSFGERRVSFAARASIRIFRRPDPNAEGSPAPASGTFSPSDPNNEPGAPGSSGDALNQQGLNPQNQTAHVPQSPSQPSSPSHRRRPHDPREDGEESMDVSADDIPPSTIISSHSQHTENGTIHNSRNDQDGDVDSEEDDGEMSMTEEFGVGIVSRRRTASLAGRDRRKSRMRSSISIPPTVDGVEATDFTVPIDRPPPPESQAFKALKAVANGNKPDHDDGVASEDGEIDMDVTTAVSRLLAIRASTGGQFPMTERVDDSFTTTEDSFEAVDAEDRTVNMTSLMGSFRASDCGIDNEEDVTMSAASMISVPISTYPPSALESSTTPARFLPDLSASTPPVPAASKSISIAQGSTVASRPPSPVKPTTSRVASPIKLPIKQFTAAFAPPHQPMKRPLSASGTDGPNALVTSPNKRRAVAASESSTRRVSVPVAPPSPEENPNGQASLSTGLPTNARRPSGYYRKSLAGAGAQPGPPAGSQPSVSTSGYQRRQSVVPSASPKRLSTAPTPKPPAFAPGMSSTGVQGREEVSCAREASKQSIATLNPTRGSPSPWSPAIKRHSVVVNSPGDASLVGAPNGNDGIMERVPQDRPASSQTQAQNVDPGQWASTIHGEDIPQDDDLAPISVDQFFTMTGIRFMDDLTCPRRSTIHPSQLRRRESNETEEEVYPISDYAVAMAVDVAQLETMSWIANDIRSAIDKYKAQYQATEEDAAKDIPFLFREYATAGEEDREQILYILKLIKAHTILSAKASWYEWKRGWVQGLLTNAERTLDNLDADEHQLADIATCAEQTLPGLRTEYEAIMRELEQERAAVAEIENCDQTFLSELKTTIAEQRQELDIYRSNITDSNAKLVRLEETLEDLEDQAREAKTAITTAQRQMDIQKTSTRAEVFRLRDELNNLQALHLWRAIRLSPEMVEFVYDSKYRVTIPCRRFLPVPEALGVVPFGDQSQANNDFPLVTELMYRIARRRAIQIQDNKLTLRTIVQHLTDFWASYTQLCWQLSFVTIKYPLSFQLLPAGSDVNDAMGFKAIATLLLFKKTSKALISFHFDSELLNQWPVSMDLLKFDVSVVYGKADPKVVGEALRTRLSEASPAENHACLVDACMEVASRYS